MGNSVTISGRREDGETMQEAQQRLRAEAQGIAGNRLSSKDPAWKIDGRNLTLMWPCRK